MTAQSAPRVLLVEDDPDACDLLSRALVRAGYVVCPVGDIHAARSTITESPSPFDVAVLDIVLVDHDQGGLELISDVRRAGHTKIVVITAFADVARIKTALNSGASYLLEKPFKAAELIALIQKFVSETEDVSWMVSRALGNAKLTERELAIARLVLKGLPSAEIARLEGISDKTVRQHLSQVYIKCGVESRAELFHYVFPS